jgi:hypothetical protein
MPLVVVAGVALGGVRRVLHHPERHSGAGEVVDRSTRLARPGADERVDVPGRVRHERGPLGVRRARGADQHHAANRGRYQRGERPS